MKNKEAAQILRRAFENTVPDSGRVLQNALNRKGTAIEMTENKRKIPLLKILAAAAAAAVIAATSITAAAFCGNESAEMLLGFTGREQAFGNAATHVVKTAETEEEANRLAGFILSGLAYDIESEDQSVTCGLSGLRAVYNVKFKVGGYSYEVKVDAKTGVVLDCQRSLDENWETYLADEIENRPEPEETVLAGGYVISGYNEASTMGDIDYADAVIIAKDAFGLTPCSAEGEIIRGWTDYSTDPANNAIQISHGGYIYECLVNSGDGSFTELYVGDDPEYIGERHTHTPDTGYITGAEAIAIADEHCAHHQFSLMFLEYTEQYAVFGKDGGDTVTVFIDAKTGEVAQVNRSDDSGVEHGIKYPSTEAPEGMISEADAVMAALESIGADLNSLEELDFELQDGEYVVTVKPIGGEEMTVRVKADRG